MAILRASSKHTPETASRNAARSCPASFSPLPFARINTVSLVLVCPSTLMQLKLRSQAVRSVW
jgi:hypothetical protein